MRVPEALARTFAANGSGEPERVTQLRAEYAEINRSTPSADPQEADRRVGRLQVIRAELAELGHRPQ